MKLYYHSSMLFLRTLLMFVFVFSLVGVNGSYAKSSTIILKAKVSVYMSINYHENSYENVIYEGVLKKGQKYEINLDRDLFLSTGNSGALSLTYGDFYLSSLGKDGEVKRNINIINLLKKNKKSFKLYKDTSINNDYLKEFGNNKNKILKSVSKGYHYGRIFCSLLKNDIEEANYYNDIYLSQFSKDIISNDFKNIINEKKNKKYSSLDYQNPEWKEIILNLVKKPISVNLSSAVSRKFGFNLKTVLDKSIKISKVESFSDYQKLIYYFYSYEDQKACALVKNFYKQKTIKKEIKSASKPVLGYIPIETNNKINNEKIKNSVNNNTKSSISSAELEKERAKRLEEERKRKALEQRIAELEKKNKELQQPKKIKQKASNEIGSGFYVSKFRHVVTNQHVVNKCKKITVGDSMTTQIPADLIASDKRNDLAILQTISMDMASAETKSFIQNLSIQIVPIVSGGLIRIEDVKGGEQVYVAGFPHGNMISDSMRLVPGLVNSTRGFENDITQFETDAVIRKGNSGGPVYDSKGNIVGIAVKRFNVTRSDNYNFAIKGSTVKQFLDAHNILTTPANRISSMTSTKIYNIASKQTVMVVCHR